MNYPRPQNGRFLIIQTTLRDHVKMVALSETLGLSEAQVTGHLVFLWAFAMEHYPDGDLSLTPKQIAYAAKFKTTEAQAFVDALLAVGFLDISPKGYALHNWYKYSGRAFLQVEKKRAYDRERQRRKSDVLEKSRHSPRRQDKTIQDKTIQDNIIYRAQNDCERGENAERVSDVSARKARARDTYENYSEDFERLWRDYPRKDRKRECYKAYNKALKTHDAATLDGAVRAFIDMCEREGRERRFVPVLFRLLAEIDDYSADDTQPQPAARKLTPKEEYERDLRAALPAYFEEEAADGSSGEEDGATVFDAEFCG